MASKSSVITEGFGVPGSASLVITDGYGIAQLSPVTAPNIIIVMPYGITAKYIGDNIYEAI